MRWKARARPRRNATNARFLRTSIMRFLRCLSRVPWTPLPRTGCARERSHPEGTGCGPLPEGVIRIPLPLVPLYLIRLKTRIGRTSGVRVGGNSVGPSETSDAVLARRPRSQSFVSDIASEAKMATLRRMRYWKAGKGYRAQPDSSGVWGEWGIHSLESVLRGRFVVRVSTETCHLSQQRLCYITKKERAQGLAPASR